MSELAERLERETEERYAGNWTPDGARVEAETALKEAIAEIRRLDAELARKTGAT